MEDHGYKDKSDLKELKEVDIFRDTPVRLLGYANEVGEAFRALIPKKVVHLSYAIASAYVLADTGDKVVKTNKALDDKKTTEKFGKLASSAFDTLIWQSLASVVIPGFTINRVCALSLYLFKKYSKLKPIKAKWATVGIGLGCIPFIVRPIDNSVDFLMDKSLRVWLPITTSVNQEGN